MQFVKANKIPGWARTNQSPFGCRGNSGHQSESSRANLPRNNRNVIRGQNQPGSGRIFPGCRARCGTAVPAPISQGWRSCRGGDPGAGTARDAMGAARGDSGRETAPSQGRMGTATQPPHAHMQTLFRLVNCFQSGRFLLISHQQLHIPLHLQLPWLRACGRVRSGNFLIKSLCRRSSGMSERNEGGFFARGPADFLEATLASPVCVCVPVLLPQNHPVSPGQGETPQTPLLPSWR